MEEQDEIIVLRSFENSIDANLAKTKLDAHGVPCFLTEENFSNLYPGQSFQLFGVRLHVFKNDEHEAKEVLADKNLTTDTTTVCPRCQSDRVEVEYSRKISSRIVTLFIGLLFFIGFPIPKVHRCQLCRHEF